MQIATIVGLPRPTGEGREAGAGGIPILPRVCSSAS